MDDRVLDIISLNWAVYSDLSPKIDSVLKGIVTWKNGVSCPAVREGGSVLFLSLF